MRSLAWLTPLLLLQACASSEGEEANHVVVLDDSVQILIAPDELELIAGPDAELPEIAVGDVLVSAQGNGVLRRVTAVSGTPARRTVATTAATVTEAIDEGSVATHVPFASGKTPDDAPEGLRGLHLDGFAFGLGGQHPIALPTIDARITGGSFEFAPDFDLDLDIDDGAVQRFEAIASGRLDASIEAEIVLTGNLGGRFKKDLWSTEYVFVQMIGLVPVVEVVELSLGVGFEVQGAGTARINLGAETSAALSIGARYLAGTWEGVGEHDLDLTPHISITEGSIGFLDVEVSVYAHLAVRLYDLAGPAIKLEPYAAIRHEAGSAAWVPRVGVRTTFLGEVQIPFIDKTWTPYQAVLFDVSQDFAPLLIGEAPADPPADSCGAVTYHGTCHDGIVEWCDDGAIATIDCTATHRGCEWVDDSIGNWCVSDCGDLGHHGACVGDSLRFCDDDQTEAVDCAAAGLSCEWGNIFVGYDCR